MYTLVIMFVGLYSGVMGSIGPITLDECQSRKAEMEKLEYPFLGKDEKIVLKCEPVKEDL